MNHALKPWQLFLLILAGWINRHQQEVIEYLEAENRVLREKFGKKRILLNDDRRRRLAVKGKVLGRKAMQEIATIVTPDTILPLALLFEILQNGRLFWSHFDVVLRSFCNRAFLPSGDPADAWCQGSHTPAAVTYESDLRY